MSIIDQDLTFENFTRLIYGIVPKSRLKNKSFIEWRDDFRRQCLELYTSYERRLDYEIQKKSIAPKIKEAVQSYIEAGGYE